MAILTILVVLVQEWALPGWGVVFVVMPLQYFFGWRIILHKKNNAGNTQERGSLFQELLPAMKLVKYYAWEQFFEQSISEVRRAAGVAACGGRAGWGGTGEERPSERDTAH